MDLEITKKISDSFWSKVEKTATCWYWRGTKDKNGYGKIVVKGKNIRAHRFAYKDIYKNIDQKLLCLHHCDVPSCVNPNHLYLGTSKDNMRDRSIRNRHNAPKGKNHWSYKHPEKIAWGEKLPQSSLDKKKVKKIKKLLKSNTQIYIAKKFSISQSTVSRISNDLIWKRV